MLKLADTSLILINPSPSNVKSILLLTYLFPGFANSIQGFSDDATVPFEDYSIPERRPTYSNQSPLPIAPNTYPDSDYDPTLLDLAPNTYLNSDYEPSLLDPAPNTYFNSDYDPSLLGSYPEEIVDGIPEPVIIPPVTKGKLLILGLFDPEM